MRQELLFAFEIRWRTVQLENQKHMLMAQLHEVKKQLKITRKACRHSDPQPFSDAHVMGTHCVYCGQRWDITAEICTTPLNCKHKPMRERLEESKTE